MANLKLVFTITSVLLCLLFLNGIVSAKARALKEEHVMRTYEMGAVEDNINLLWRRSIMENAAKTTTTLDSPNNEDKWINDFRPTDPGHSPGAGHSSPTPKEATNNGAPKP
ncbi:hypothetical protein ACSQ67_000176 [Phaseolus vulgaris]